MRRLHAAGADQESALALEDFLDAVTVTSSLEVGRFVQAALTSGAAFPIHGCLAHAGLDLEIQAYAAEAWISQAQPCTTFDEIVNPSTR